jgi:hypothetical protein
VFGHDGVNEIILLMIFGGSSTFKIAVFYQVSVKKYYKVNPN